MKFSDDIPRQIGIDITEYRGARYKQFDDLLDGLLCAYLAYYYWFWERRALGCLGACRPVMSRSKVPSEELPHRSLISRLAREISNVVSKPHPW